MTTAENIARRVEENDAARSARRTKAAQLVGGLARERTAVVHRLADIDQQIGDVIVESSDVIGVDELALFTDVPAAELSRILDARKPTRGRRKRSPASPPAEERDRDQHPAPDSAGREEAGTP